MQNEYSGTCILCTNGDSIFRGVQPNHMLSYSCPLCGDYSLEHHDYQRIIDLQKDHKFRIACIAYELNLKTRVASGRPLEYVIVREDQREQAQKAFCERVFSLEQMLEMFPRGDQIVERSLLNLARLASHPVEYIKQEWKITSRAVFTEHGHYAILMQDLIDLDYLKALPQGLDKGFRITPRGWEQIGKWQKPALRRTKQAFVAMWFNDVTNKYWEHGLKPAIKKAGYIPVRIDKAEHNNKICDQIVAEIRRSRFLVADFTAGTCIGRQGGCARLVECAKQVIPRGGVYFEAGYAMGLGIPVVWVVREDQIDTVHFDTRQFNHVRYADAEELEERLYYRIVGTVGEGPER